MNRRQSKENIKNGPGEERLKTPLRIKKKRFIDIDERTGVARRYFVLDVLKLNFSNLNLAERKRRRLTATPIFQSHSVPPPQHENNSRRKGNVGIRKHTIELD